MKSDSHLVSTSTLNSNPYILLQEKLDLLLLAVNQCLVSSHLVHVKVSDKLPHKLYNTVKSVNKMCYWTIATTTLVVRMVPARVDITKSEPRSSIVTPILLMNE